MQQLPHLPLSLPGTQSIYIITTGRKSRKEPNLPCLQFPSSNAMNWGLNMDITNYSLWGDRKQSKEQGYKSLFRYKLLHLLLCPTQPITPWTWCGFNFSRITMWMAADSAHLSTVLLSPAPPETEQLCPSLPGPRRFLINAVLHGLMFLWARGQLGCGAVEHGCGAHPKITQCQHSKFRAACTIWRDTFIQHSTRT